MYILALELTKFGKVLKKIGMFGSGKNGGKTIRMCGEKFQEDLWTSIRRRL